MTSTAIFYTIITILCIFFIIERIISYLNLSYSSHPLPNEISDLYDSEKRKKQLAYQHANTYLSTLDSCTSLIFVLLVICLGGFGWLDNIVKGWFEFPVWQALAFFCIFFVAQHIIHLPFNIYDTFVIEERFGFNRTTAKTFVTDELKSLGLNILINGLIFGLITYIYTIIPDWFWLIAWSVVMAFSIFMSLFYSNLIVPLFNKQTPLPEGELRTAIEQFAAKVGFKIDNIYVMDSSKRSSHANAYFTGFGRRKRIVLYDTLIDSMTTDEIVAVLAHEIGHNQHHDTIKNIVSAAIHNLIVFGLLGLTLKLDVVAQAVGAEVASFHVNMIVFTLLFSPISELIDVFENILSRHNEYEADRFATENGMGEHLIAGLKKLTTDSLGNPMPHSLAVFLTYSHPTLYQRIVAIRNNEKH